VEPAAVENDDFLNVLRVLRKVFDVVLGDDSKPVSEKIDECNEENGPVLGTVMVVAIGVLFGVGFYCGIFKSVELNFVVFVVVGNSTKMRKNIPR
jgi:hypothetical protein